MRDEKRDQSGALYGQLTDEVSRRLRKEASETAIASDERAERCETCKFWELQYKIGMNFLGACCRFPPVFVNDPSAPMFPVVSHKVWCGEWQPKPEAKTDLSDMGTTRIELG